MREICNGWKSDHAIASVAKSASIGKLVTSLMDWKEGARLAQDSVLWKPPKVLQHNYLVNGWSISTYVLGPDTYDS